MHCPRPRQAAGILGTMAGSRDTGGGAGRGGVALAGLKGPAECQAGKTPKKILPTTKTLNFWYTTVLFVIGICKNKESCA